MSGWRISAAGVAAAGLVFGGAFVSPALASVADEERVFRQDALAHAEAIASAYRRLEEHILLRSTAITSWPSSIPPGAPTGWLASWTLRGVKARYCDDTLLVYLDPEKLKGVGEDHRSVHAAPHAFVGEGNASRFPALHWLEANVAKGGKGRLDVPLPGCMTTDALPSGRAALAGRVIDPWITGPGPGRQRSVVSRGTRTEACPSGMHGAGRRYAREVTEEENGRGDVVPGTRSEGSWQLIADACRPDYGEWVEFSVPCSATPDGSDTEMFGVEVWRRLRSVSADGVNFGDAEIVSSECEANPVSREITPQISEIADPQSMSVACGEGYTGSRRYTRIVTTRSTKFPWDVVPVVTVRWTSWRLASSTCEAEVVVNPPECDPEVEDCEGEPKCDPVVDLDCGEGAGEAVEVEAGTYTVDADHTRRRQCSAVDSNLTGTFEETQTCRYTYDLHADGTRTQTDMKCWAWWMSADNCAPKPGVEAQPPGPPGTPGSGQCGPPSDGTGSPATGDTCEADPGLVASLQGQVGSGGAGSGGGGCYLTTAVVEHRGVEGDDGPTLTALRQFRDTYMMETPVRRALVRLYYRLAPAISRDLKADSAAWDEIGRHIDSAVEALESGDRGKAFRAYWAASTRAFSLWAAFKVKRALA